MTCIILPSGRLAKGTLPMPLEVEPIYPNCPTVIRVVTIGGLTKAELLEQLQRNAILLNESADKLFASDRFTTAATRRAWTTVELTVRDLGFSNGATTAAIYARAAALGLGLCPLELGPHLRLHYRDQPEGYWGQPLRHHQAPSGSITIASEPLTHDDDFPKGFYVRRIKGELWLRGYRAGPEHVWEADDHLLFCQP
jgi:hypothetical protein